MFAKLLAPWGALVSILAIATLTTASLGFDQWPIGETRNWIWILQKGPGIDAASVFWGIDSRNPLSPWWYITLRPLFENTDQAFVIMQLAMGPLLGISIYLLVDEICRGQEKLLAVSSAILCSLTLASADIGGVTWNFTGAAACSVLTIWTYLRAHRSPHRPLAWLAASYAFWLLAIGTYTLQSGAVIAIGGLTALFLTAGKPLHRRALASAVVVAPYLLILMLVAYWKTYDYGILDLPMRPSLSAFARSLSFGFGTPTHYDIYWTWARDVPAALTIAFLVIPSALTAIILWTLRRNNGSELFRPKMILAIAIVAAALVAPTVALESSSSTWAPGTRWPMLTQLWVPLLAVVIFSAPLSRLRNLSARRNVFVALVAIYAGAICLIYAGMNTRQVAFSKSEREFFVALRRVVKEDQDARRAFPRHYVVHLSDPTIRVPPAGFTARSYADTVLRDLPTITYRYVSDSSPITRDGDTVGNVSMFYKEVPSARVELLEWDGKNFTRSPGDREPFSLPTNTIPKR
jgi:hypothetical protein